jgi:transcriptional regulator with XRE-family HTH domain
MAATPCAAAPVKKTTPTDEYVATAVRFRRKELGLTQADLAGAIGVTFQQVQKYENGTSRILAGRLFAISQALQAPVSHFLQPVNGAGSGKVERAAAELLKLPGASALLWHYARIEEPAHRRNVLEFARSLARQEDHT